MIVHYTLTNKCIWFDKTGVDRIVGAWCKISKWGPIGVNLTYWGVQGLPYWTFYYVITIKTLNQHNFKVKICSEKCAFLLIRYLTKVLLFILDLVVLLTNTNFITLHLAVRNFCTCSRPILRGNKTTTARHLDDNVTYNSTDPRHNAFFLTNEVDMILIFPIWNIKHFNIIKKLEETGLLLK